MSIRKLFVTTLAIITLLSVACASDGDSLFSGNATPETPTATPDLLSQSLTELSDLDLENLDISGIRGLIEGFPDATGFSECLTSSIGLAGLMELAEREPTHGDVEMVTSCLSEDQLAALTSAAASGLNLGDFNITAVEGLTQELLNSPELAECLTSSISFSDLMELAESQHSDAQELIAPCLNEDQLDLIQSGTVSESHLGSLEEFDMSGITQELMNNPETIECLTSSMSLSSLMEMAGREPTEAEIELLSSCFSEDQLEALGGLTGSP